MQQKHFVLLILCLALSLGAFSQFYYGGLSSSFEFPRTKYIVDSTGNLFFKPGDLRFSMQLGTGFGSDLHGNSYFSTYASPALAYNVSKRFRLKAGVTVFNTSGDFYFGGYDSYYSPVMSGGTGTRVFVQGDYILSNKFMLSGAAYKDFSFSNFTISDPRLKQHESQGVILNLNYRPIRNLEINASFEYGNGYHSLYHDPFYQGSFFQAGSSR